MYISRLIQSIFETNSERPFLFDHITGPRTITYGQFESHVGATVARLYGEGLHRGSRVALFSDNQVDCIVLYFACLAAGITIVPINPALSQSDLHFIFKHSKVEAVITRQTSLASIAQLIPLTCKVLVLSDIVDTRDQSQRSSTLWSACSDDNFFSIHFTSGTTSRPKGVFHRVSSLCSNALDFSVEFGLSRESRMLHVMPMTYMAGLLNTVLCPFMVGGSVVLAPQFNAQTILSFWEPIVTYSANTMWLSPTMLNALLKLDRTKAGREHCQKYVDQIFVGTAPLALQTSISFEEKYGKRVSESYGLSELLLISANHKDILQKPNSVGRLLSKVNLSFREAEDGSTQDGFGEIMVSTPYQMAGYLNYETGEPDLLPPQTPFPTGDVGYIEGRDYLYITSRKKDLIIKGGFNISPRAVEEVILSHPAVEECAVIGVPHDFYGEEVVAVLILKDSPLSSPQVEAEVLKSCKATLTPNSVPGAFYVRSSFPRSVVGKIQKNALKEQILAARQSHTASRDGA